MAGPASWLGYVGFDIETVSDGLTVEINAGHYEWF